MLRKFSLPFLLGLGLLLLAALGGYRHPTVAAQLSQSASNDTCLACHSMEGMQKNFADGSLLVLTIDKERFAQSVHAAEGLTCVSCHTDIAGFPHPEVKAQNAREYTIQQVSLCKQCHTEQFEKSMDSVHQKALDAGNANAAVCIDCHNPHQQSRLKDPQTGQTLPEMRVLIPQTCARCHSSIYNTYRNSVHGTALTEENNPDVPTCIDCHGIHNIPNPTTAQFRNDIPLLCARCHTDPKRMSKYGLSTEVLNTYVADFHGTTITLFEKVSASQPSNKAVCIDCHGIHDISRVNDPQTGIAIKQNLLLRCQRCHPDATTETFTDAWLGHYIPNPQKYPLIYYVNLFYKIFIPTVLGGMAIFVASDIYRTLRERVKGAKHHE